MHTAILSLIAMAGVSSTSLPALAAPSATAPETSPAARPTGRWHCWTDCTNPQVIGYGKESLWFAAMTGGALWRYDGKTQQMQAFTCLDGLPLDVDMVKHITVADDGACAVCFFYDQPVILWQPGKGWRSLGRPPGDRSAGPIAYDPEGILHYLQWSTDRKSTIFRWDKTGWKSVREVPACQAFIPLEKGYLISSMGLGGGSGPAYVLAEGGDPVVYEKAKQFTLMAQFQLPGKTLALFSESHGRTFYRVTPEDLVEESRGIGMDLTGNGFLTLVHPAVGPDRGDRFIGSTTDDRVTGPIYRLGSFLIAVRDANGHIWTGPCRWDGKEWKQFLPENHLADHMAVMDCRKFAFDDSTMTWVRINEHVPPVFQESYDPATRTAWWTTTVDRVRVWQQVKLNGKDRRVLRSMPAPDLWGSIEFEDAAGNWWMPARGQDGTTDFYCAARFDQGGGVHIYRCESGIAGGYRPQMQRSPAGNAWLWTQKGCSRYDAKEDKFVVEEPWDEFAFQFGPWTLSIAGKVTSAGQSIYRKEKGVWKPLTNPFGRGEAMGGREMIRGDRMLITVREMGVLEYDATNDRWVLLHPGADFRACFDTKGRRILVNRNCVLMFDGDPFAPASSPDEAALVEVLRLMDDPSWRVREAATEDLKRLFPTMRSRITAILERGDLSPEVLVRIKRILQEMKDQEQAPRESLFRRMHPLTK